MAAIQSQFATAKLNGIEPSAWLKDTLEKLPVWTMRRIDELLHYGINDKVSPIFVSDFGQKIVCASVKK